MVLIERAEADFEERSRKRVQKETAEAMIVILDKALQGSDGEKSLAFRKIAEFRIGQIREGLELVVNGDRFYEDDDNRHYLSEEVDLIIFGRKFFDAYNQFERLFT